MRELCMDNVYWFSREQNIEYKESIYGKIVCRFTTKYEKKITIMTPGMKSSIIRRSFVSRLDYLTSNFNLDIPI
jgi:cellulose synthase/poly-beta-1,6-N-acetylglucosamine synthase-like glycosyltransferase